MGTAEFRVVQNGATKDKDCFMHQMSVVWKLSGM